jgi:2',3'-cyclic-nucleotide 2'-phosphodiesterase (5'-nucleotidase family)
LRFFRHTRQPTPIRPDTLAGSPQRLILLHTNDMHGRIEGMERIGTLIERIRAEHADLPVLYFDLGDVEESTVRLSSLTKGVAMHRLLNAMGCDAAAVGNAVLPRYGLPPLAAHGEVAHYPLLLANLRLGDGSPLPGTQPRALLQAGSLRLGLIGISSELDGEMYQRFLGLRTLPPGPLVRELAAALRQDGADAVILLSHMGLEVDRQLAAELQGEAALILGAHTHDLLPEGERIGEVTLAQAGQFAEHLGRVELLWDGARLRVERVSVLDVTEEVPPAPRVVAEVAAAEADLAHEMEEVIGELAAPLDYAWERECGTGNLVADMLREHMGGEVGLAGAVNAIATDLPAGPLRRGIVWEYCGSSANPGVTELTGAQLRALVARGLDPELAAERPRLLRHQPRGIFSLSGATVRDGELLVGGEPVVPERVYRVAATDWELDAGMGYAQAEWGHQITYDFPTIVREALEPYLQRHRPITVALGRVDGPLAP